ncbi:MAG: ABC transporter permease [Gammaproteobacteria bacterium]|nr:ABC transporter permease [Gammaproteobacteria bacterium]
MPIKLLLQMSVRNILRHRRRNGMMLAAVVVAVAAVVMMNSLIRGMQQDMADAAVENLVGHVKVLAPGYRDDPGIQRNFELASDWRPPDGVAEVAGWAMRVRVPAVIMSERGTRGIQFVGVNPQQEGISFLSSARMTGDSLKDASDGRIIIGQALAEQLETGLGRRLVIITQGADGLNREAGFRIAGLYDADGEGMEKFFVFTGVGALQKMVGAAVFTELSIRLHQEPALFALKEILVELFTGLEVLDWRELEPQAAAMFIFADAAVLIWFFVMMGALVFGLVNTLVTSVMERIRELGMLRAVGMRPRSVVAQVVIESSVLMLIGVAVGIALGLAGIFAMGDGLDLSLWSEGVESFGMRTLLRPVPLFDDVLLIALLSLGLGVVASVYPAWRAIKIKPLEALRR